MTTEPEPPAYCLECGDEVEDDEGYWGFCSEACYDEFEDSCSE